MKQQIRYCTTPGGIRLAYAVIGSGPPIIRTSHWMTHIQHDLTSPVWRHQLLGLAQHHTLVRYDPRGEGLSQRENVTVSFGGWMEDLETVVAAAGFDRFTLFGSSQGAATAILYAARNPQRIDYLILYGGFAEGMRSWADPQELALARSIVRQGWGSRRDAHRQWFSSLFMPDAGADEYRWHNRMQRLSASPAIAEQHLIAASELDVRSALPKVAVPTLVLHARGDNVVPIRVGEQMAAAIRDARFVPLDGNDHLLIAGSTAHREFLEAVADFLGDPPPPRVLPGTGDFHERLELAVSRVEGNWAIKLALLTGAAIGLALSVVQIWEWLRG